MDEVFETIKKSAQKAIIEAERLTKQAMEKSSSTVNQVKLKYAIKENETKIEELMIELGSHVYDEHTKGTQLNEDLADTCSKIDELKEEIQTIKQKIAELKECTLCPACGEANPKENNFCAKCGGSLENEK